MRALLVTLGSHGDVHPFIALGRALRSRGHSAAVLTNPHFAPVVEHAGLPCLPIAEAVDIKDVIASSPVMDAHRGPMVVMRDLMLPVVPQVYEQTRNAIRDLRADVCLVHPICMGASWAAERAGVPCDTVALAPTIWFNPNDRLVMSAWGSPEPARFTVRAQIAVGRSLMRLALDPGLNRVRRTLGLPRVRSGFFREALGGRLNLGLWSEHFRPEIDGDPPTGRICGFPWHDTLREPDPEREHIDRFLDDGDPPIVFTLGTAAVHAAGDFYAHAPGVCAALGRRGLLLVGRDEYLPRTLPPGLAAFCYAPYSRLLPRAAAIVHHAGIGTTAQVLRSGRPSVPVPFAHDQFDNASRLQRLGVARIAKKGRAFVSRLTDALRAVLDNPLFAAQAASLGQHIASEDGALCAVLELERVSGGPPAHAIGQPLAHA